MGQARDLRSRLRDHLKKVENREGITVDEVTCRFLTIERTWEVLRAEAALSRRYNTEWNGTPGFSMHVPRSGGPACRAM
ncbi:MAG: Eco29kI family restriction endonuclease [Deltaproteobacteria bacterium]|nr:Eco29kI family restriction endonuclease [Deltaproteobacteria bacterium]